MLSFISEPEAMEHCDRQKGCDLVFGESFFDRIGKERFEGSFSGERWMKSLDLEEEDEHAVGISIGKQSFKPRGPGGPGEGAIGYNACLRVPM